MDDETFTANFFSHKDAMYLCALDILGDKNEAMDIVQDVFERLWMLRESWNYIINPESYCIAYVVRMCKIKSMKVDNEIILSKFSNIMDHTYDAFDSVYIEKLEKSTIDLNAQQQRVIKLRFYEKYTITEIAQNLNIKEESVYTLLSRIYKILRKKLVY